jgi:pimeloyl-ACP methyl ester carboxylesterase
MSEPLGHTTTINECELYYEVHGAGDPVLCLHGFTGSSGDWFYAGREGLEPAFMLITPDARGHGRSTNPTGTLTHRQCAHDALALLDHLGLEQVKAIGLSMGGNTLLHLATLTPSRVTRMVLISSTMYFPDQARRVMAEMAASQRSEQELRILRERHKHGDPQIRALERQQLAFQADTTDMTFTPASLSRIETETLLVSGDRDPLYPVDMAVTMYHALPNAALWVVPGGGHGPIFLNAAATFSQTTERFLKGGVQALS